ncbi:hypothetical protein NADFUDRAFT_74895 [Nadsonia fulvescens var. elongata DSM 6958]|uniref:Amino acid permease/ SLC12A domain-containing protein n=1 Tax=Nadsonia fulvescens var. elongata DSM 6958 TaxID=857566 RepID=A0A1E3PGN4_9ASCO|nr:hypothetical protein NADFUDRAFT_74895 [Nadsonia fulvescens var. elongata DSM 6958]
MVHSDLSSISHESMHIDFSHKPDTNAKESKTEYNSDTDKDIEQNVSEDNLARALSARQIQMIAIAGVIGTGLFLGTGKSLATGGPAALLICYVIMGIIVYMTMISLGEMATYMPVAGSFCTYASRFVDDSFGFSLTWNYWFNDAVSTASDLTALQLVFAYWNDFPAWIISLIFWVFLLVINFIHVRVYGEVEYWLALLKVVTIVIFFIMSIICNAGVNETHEYIGFVYWNLGDAPFVNGFKGFASVFVTASFAYGGTESIGVTAGETRNPSRIMPKVVRTVFWRIVIFYILTVFLIGITVPYTYPNLSNKSTTTSPFTIVFQRVGTKAAGSFITAVIMTSVISAGNHALFAGTRLLYTLGCQGYAPRFFSKITKKSKIPYVALLSTWFVSGLCFGSSFIGAGNLWNWLQNLVGVSNQISWVSIGLTSIRFRKGIEAQGKTHLLKYKNWTYPYGPWFVVIATSVIILIQGWSAFAPWDISSFFSYYIELAVFPLLYLGWKIWKRSSVVKYHEMDLETDRYIDTEEDLAEIEAEKNWNKKEKTWNIFKSFFI